MNLFEAVIDRIDGVIRIFLTIMMALLVLDVTWQVLTRFIFPQPSSFTEEVARFLLIWISLIGGAYAYRTNSHLGFDLIVRKVSKTKAIFLERFCSFLVAVFAIAVLLVGGINLVEMTWTLGQFSPVLNIPMAFVYMVIPLSGVLFLLYSIQFFFQAPNNPASKEIK
jgi:TRAP-type C4-dicarboxylate transport system permease small subunit